jgi:hypothetical protein
MAAVLQAVLQMLPLGNWLTQSPYGIIYGTLLFDAFSCMLLLLSKFIFKEYFVSVFHKKMVVLGVGGTAFLISACYMYIAIKLVPSLSSHLVTEDFSHLLPIYYALTLIAYMFFLFYLIDFIIRLVHYKKQKNGVTFE